MTTGRERYGEDFGAEPMWGLVEAPLPEAVSYLPQTGGWLAVAVLLVSLLIWWALRRRAAWRRDAWRREALAELAAMEGDTRRLAGLPHLLRRCALALAPRVDIASLRGEAWIAWLNGRAGRTHFTREDAARLDALAYESRPVEDDDARIAKLCAAWLRGRHARV